jgi:hypothetical protein
MTNKELKDNEVESMIHSKGYDFIKYKLIKLGEEMPLRLDENRLLHYYLTIGNLYGEKLDNNFNLLSSYQELIQNNKIEGFSLAKWESIRNKNYVENNIKFFAEKYKGSDDVNIMEFIKDYFQLIVQELENAGNELFKIIKDNNIKFN